MAEWDRILQKEEYQLEEPDKIVVHVVSVLEDRRVGRILDLGCGAGRHVVYFAEKGFETYGADISETGLVLTKKRLGRRRLEAEMIKCDMKSIPYVSSCFDAVLCVQAIYHQRLKEIQQTISEVHRILKRRGLLLVNLHSKRSDKYGVGTELEDGTFIQGNGPEKGVPHHFFDEGELRELLRDFEVDIEVKEKKVGDYLRSLFIVLAEKV